jgi:hypothetical protein
MATPPVPSAGPSPPPIIKLPFVTSAGFLTTSAAAFMTQFWAALFGTGGVVSQIGGLLGKGLTEGYIWIGNGDGQAAEQLITGDMELATTGATTVLKSQGLYTSTIAGLAALAPALGNCVVCTDLGGGAGILSWDGTVWRRNNPGLEAQSGASMALTVLTNAEEQLQSSALAANGTITLAQANSYAGARFRWIRARAGAFTLAFVDGNGSSTLYTSASGATETVEFVSDGAHWNLAQHSTL